MSQPKNRWRENTEELYKKDLNDPDNHDVVVIHPEPDILECGVKWALGSTAVNKVSGGDGIPAEFFKILKDDAIKVLHLICQQIWKTQQLKAVVTNRRYWQSVSQFSHSVVSDCLRYHELQHTKPPCPSLTPGVYPNSCPLSWWCHPTISSSGITWLESFPKSGSFQMSQPFASGGQSTGVSASVLPMTTQDWFPLGWTGWISLQSKRLSRVFSNTTAQKHQFFGTQLSSLSNSHIHTWSLDKP